VQDAAGRELARRERGKFRLHHAALVVALLRPGIGKEEVDRGERAIADHVLEHIERVVADDAQVGELLALDAIQQAADARAMHLDRHEIGFGVRLGDLERGLAHAGADLEHELFRGSNLLIRKGDAVLRKQFFEGSLLSRCRSTLPENITADRPVQAAFGAIFPSVGELGAAL